MPRTSGRLPQLLSATALVALCAPAAAQQGAPAPAPGPAPARGEAEEGAAEAPAARAEPHRLDPILVERRDALSFAADRATAVYVSDAELERARTGDLRDVFAGIASVSVGGALPLTQKIFVNGVDMLNLGVVIDGTAQNNRAFHHVSANAIDPGLLKQVRADPTVAAADAGPFALAGSVVFETVDAADLIAPGATFGGVSRLAFDSNGRTFQGAQTLAGMAGGFEILGYFKRAKGGDYEDGAGRTVLGTGANLVSFLGKAAYEGAGHRVEFSAQRAIDDETRQFRANFGGTNGVTDNLRLYESTRESYAFSYERPEGEGLFDPRLHVGYSESRIVVPTPYASDGTSGTWSATLQNTFHFGPADTLDAGVDLQTRFGHYLSPPFDEDQREGFTNLGGFVQARLQPLAPLTVSFGGRVDHQVFDGVNGQKLENTGLSGNLSATVEVAEGVALRAGASSVFGGIVIEDNYEFFRMLAPGAYDGLEPARATNGTVGFDWALGDVTLGGEVFGTRIENARTNVSTIDFESRGANLGVTWGWSSGFLRATISHSEARAGGDPADSFTVQDFGAPLGTVLAVEVEQDVPGVPGLMLGGVLDVAFDRDAEGAFADRSPEGHQAVSLYAEYTPPEYANLTVRAGVNNLFDADFADRATYGGDFQSVTTLREPGRSFAVTGTLRF